MLIIIDLLYALALFINIKQIIIKSETIDLFVLANVNYHFKACVRGRGGNLGVCCEPPKPARQLLPLKPKQSHERKIV